MLRWEMKPALSQEVQFVQFSIYICFNLAILCVAFSHAVVAIISKLLETWWSDKFMQGHISVFLGVEVKDEFPAWRPSCLKFSQQETSMLRRKEKQFP